MSVCLQGTSLCINDYNNAKIRLLNMVTGIISTFVGSGVQATVNGQGTLASFFGPWGCAWNSSSTLLIADYAASMIRAVRMSDRMVTTVTTIVTNPSGMWVDPSTYSIYVSRGETSIYRKRLVDRSFSLWLGSDTSTGLTLGSGTSVVMSGPRYIVGEGQGRIFVA